MRASSSAPPRTPASRAYADARGLRSVATTRSAWSSGQQRLHAAAAAQVEHAADQVAGGGGGQGQARGADAEHLLRVDPGRRPARVVRAEHLDAAVPHGLQPGQRAAVVGQPAARHAGRGGPLGRDRDARDEQPGERGQRSAAGGAAQQRRQLVAVEVGAGGHAEQVVEGVGRPAGRIQGVAHLRGVGEQGGGVDEGHRRTVPGQPRTAVRPGRGTGPYGRGVAQPVRGSPRGPARPRRRRPSRRPSAGC